MQVKQQLLLCCCCCSGGGGVVAPAVDGSTAAAGQQSQPTISGKATPAKRRRPAAAVSGGSAEVSPRTRLPRAAAAGVATLVAQQLCSNDDGDNDGDDGQPLSKRMRKAADSDSYSGGVEEADQVMEDAVSPPQQTPRSKQKQQQKQQPSWVTERVATKLSSEQVVGEVQGAFEEKLFLQLLPQFAQVGSSSSLSPLRLPASSVDLRGMAAAWNAQAADHRTAGKQCTYKDMKQLRTHFVKVSGEHRRSTAKQTGQASAAAACCCSCCCCCC